MFLIELFCSHDNIAAPAIDDGIEAFGATCCQISVTSARAGAENSDSAIHIRKGTQILHRASQIANCLVIGNASLAAHFRSDIFRGTVTGTEIEIRRDGYISVVGKSERR